VRDRDLAWRVGDVSREVVPDLPDRVIAATAVQLGLPVVTRDPHVQAAGIETIW
jgi:predicted nucleic acid-binding protein